MNNGLLDRRLTAIAIDPNTPSTLYAGADTGLYKSTDSGSSWKGTSFKLRVFEFVATPDSLYITNDNGVHKSTDGGASWVVINSGLKSTWVPAIAVDPTDSNVAYVVAGTGISKTSNGGANWFELNRDGFDGSVVALAIDPINTNNMYAATGGSRVRLYRSPDGGVTWNVVNSGPPPQTGEFGLGINFLGIPKTNPNVLYISTNKGVYKSDNSAADWAVLGVGLTGEFVNSLVVSPFNADEIYAITGGGIYRIVTTGCTYTLSANEIGVLHTGGTGSIEVNTQSPCGWQAVSDAKWITITSATDVSGSGTVTFNVAPNPDSNSRKGSLFIAGQAFTVRQTGTASECVPKPVNVGQPINETITGSDCLSPLLARLAKRYSFTGSAGQTIAIQLSSSVFDAYLTLLDANGNILTQDDNSGGNRNARIPATGNSFTLPSSGSYSIEVTSSQGNSTGNFTLTLSGVQITGITGEGKHLVISGAGFGEGATIYRNGSKLKKTSVESSNRILCRKAFKSTSLGDAFKVINGDGTQSNEWIYQ